MLSPDELRFFAAIAAADSLAGAARTLDVTPPAVTQRLRNLEARLGVRLAQRTGRHLTLTDEGVLLASRGRVILDELGDLHDAIAARRGSVVGHLQVLASLGFGRKYVAPALASFRQTCPDVTIDLTLKDRLGRHPGDSCDIAIHVGELPDSSLLVRKIAPNRRIVCASPIYLREHPEPLHPRDLARHSCMVLRENDEDVTMWRFSSPQGGIAVRIEPSLATNDGEVLRAWGLGGHGIIIRSEWDVAEDLRSGALAPLLQSFSLPAADVVALLGSRRGRTPRTQLFLDHLRARLTPVPWRAETSEPVA